MQIIGLTLPFLFMPLSPICYGEITAYNDKHTASGNKPISYFTVAVRSKYYFNYFKGDLLYSKEYGLLRVDDWGTFYDKKTRALDIHINKSTYAFGIKKVTFWVVSTKHPDKWKEYMDIVTKHMNAKYKKDKKDISTLPFPFPKWF